MDNLALPAYIDREAWAGFCEMRKASGRSRPFTARAAKLVLFELDRLKRAGHDPNASLDQSTRLGWADVYPPKSKDIGAGYTTAVADALRSEAEAFANRTPEQIEAAKAAKALALASIKRIA